MLISDLRPGTRIWAASVLALTLSALVEIVAPHFLEEGLAPARLLQHATWALTLLAGLIAAVATVKLRYSAEPDERRPQDLAMMVNALIWLVLALITAWSGVTSHTDVTGLAIHITYQLSVAAVAYLLLVSVSAPSARAKALWLAYAVTGLALLAWSFGGPGGNDRSYLAWKVCNVVFFAGLFFALRQHLLRRGGLHAWLVFGASLLALGIGLNDMVVAQAWDLAITWTHYVFAGYLLMMWMLITGRMGVRGGAPPWDETLALDRSQDPDAGSQEPSPGLGSDAGPTDGVAQERSRIARELHDGVGSQIVSLLSALDRSVPQQREMASALEQCLVDIKLLVDAIEDKDECVIDSLGRLRYRVQHALDQLDIRMVWAVDVDGPLEQVRHERSRQVMRITQECLANVMRHSQATTVWVTCRYLPEPQALFLSIRDDGQGLKPGEGAGMGNGLAGMRLRASTMGGRLDIAGDEGRGTCVELTLPLASPEASV
jgi:signal transduction histidine kinase